MGSQHDFLNLFLDFVISNLIPVDMSKRKGYKNIEVAKITGLHVNTITKVKRHL